MFKGYGIFVNEDGCIPYAEAIVRGMKPIETRSRNMLGKLVGHTVAVVRTRRNKYPLIVGFVTIESADFRSAEWLDHNRDKTLIPPGSKYDSTARGKWCYTLAHPFKFHLPIPLPTDAIRHGRSYCEF